MTLSRPSPSGSPISWTILLSVGGDGCYDIALRDGHFVPSRPHHGTPSHVARFSPSHTAHVHVHCGEEDDHYGEE